MKKFLIISITIITILCAAIGEYFFNYAIVNKEPKGISYEYIENDKDKLAVILHGYKTNSKRMYIEKDIFLKLGYSVLLIDNQSKYYTFGEKEKRIVIDKLKEYSDKDIVLYGMSMGAATALQASTEEDFPKNVKKIIVDSPFDDIYSIFKSKLKSDFNLPPFPVLPLATLATKLHIGIDLKKVKSSNNIEKVKQPILFLHSKDDKFVDISHSINIYEKYKGPKEYVTFEGVGHCEMDQKQHELYEEAIKKFLNNY